MSQLKTFKDFEKIVVNEYPLIDVRAPIEFEKGAFINAVNMPIMTDEERRLVGIKYKEQGSEEATKLGHSLVTGEVKKERVDGWIQFIKNHPHTYIYCFRGGQRSGISQQWLSEAGVNIERLEGGYKAFRNYLMKALEPVNIKPNPVILGGHTGSGKTILLKEYDNFVDLEGIANHRGSSFGGNITAQPSQINFENNLAYDLIKKAHQGYNHILLEDEGRHVGKRYLPKELAEHFRKAPLVVLKIPFEERVEITFKEYVQEAQSAYTQAYGMEDGLEEWVVYLAGSIKKAEKRLGGERFNRIMKAFDDGLALQYHHGDLEKHKEWIRILLKEYYDPMYEYQLEQNKNRIVFRGSKEEVRAYLRQYSK